HPRLPFRGTTWMPGTSAGMTTKIDPGDTNEPARISLFHRRAPRSQRDPYAFGARAERAGRARPRDRAVLRARLQYREPYRLRNREPETSLPHHHRHHGDADGDR